MRAIDDGQVACEDCGAHQVKLVEEDISFQYGLGDDEVTLVAKTPVWQCDACGGSWTAQGAERAQNDAISGYLGRMRRTEIRALRTRAGLSQAQFAKAVDVGEASVKRWEAGTTVPNRSTNALLLKFQAGVSPASAAVTAQQPITRRFRTSAPQRRLGAAIAFDLSAPFPPRALAA